MTMETSELRFRGQSSRVPSRVIEGREVISVGRWLRIATVNDEEWLTCGVIKDPDKFVSLLRQSGLAADIFAFSGSLDEGASGGEAYRRHLTNAAVIRTDEFKAWWDGLPQETRKNARRAAKKGIEVRSTSFDDAFAAGIKAIYDETPIRQGRKFWHYGKDLAAVKSENSSFLQRSEFIGAYYSGELVGFIKLVYVGNVGRIMQILSLNSHQDKRPIIALIVKAAEICRDKGFKYLAYGKFRYGNKSDSMTEFKRRLGFVQVDFPRYYIPLTARGRVALMLGLHRDVRERLPSRVVEPLRAARRWWLQKRNS